MIKIQKTSTVALINNNNKLLILKRGSTAPWMPNRYCLPGGHVDNNESLEQCAVRELLEETDISIDIKNLYTVNISYPPRHKVVFYSYCSNQPVTLNWEHSDYRWVSSSESSLYPLVPSLKATIKVLTDRGYMI